jgi:hypothetical protein
MKVWYETKKSGLLLLRFRHEGKRYTLTTGLKDSAFNRSIALAEQTGHDKRVLLSTYAHAINQECPFVDLE